MSQTESHAGAANFLIVGLGASAGGVEALQEFFTQVSAESGIAYVVILHLSPEHESQLANILQTVTSLPVTQVVEAVRVVPDHVYVVPPNQHLAMVDGQLTVSPNTLPEERRAPVDIFFRTLAETHDSRAVCVVLSGTGADGSMGLKRVKERGGVVFVQSPREATFNEMPRSAIATDLVDGVLPVAAIPARISAYQASLGTIAIPLEADRRPEEQQQALREVFTQLRVHTGHDFSNYKRPTLLRRIERRINVRSVPDLPAYAAFLRDHPDEVQALLKDLLISVTNFFRDKEAFAALEQEIIPRVFQGKRPDQQVRIWVVGCATGEEAYSIAMLCAERTQGTIDAPDVQIFASDIGEAAIAHAREGLYTPSDTADVSPERLRRFFTQEDQRYRIRREIREMVLFANHNVLKDPPFSHIDLVTCRNLLIYLNHSAQERVIETLHFALEPGGYLFLGASESVDGATDLFSTVSREQHIYQSRNTTARPFPIPEPLASMRGEPRRAAPLAIESEARAGERISYGDLHLRLLEQYAPPSAVLNEDFDVVHLSGRAGRYLQIADGALSRNLLGLIRPELRAELRTALYQAMQRQTNVQASNLPIRIDDRAETVTIHVRPVLRQEDPARGFLLVVFEQGLAPPSDAEPVVRSGELVAQQREDEAQRLRQQLRASGEQYETAVEELKATNEELQALNEELRSSAEELETSKEELQSINEELRTVNQELKVKVEEATQHSTNLQNLVNSTNIGTIFLDRGLRVKLFTPAARELFNLIPADYGRPLSDITHRLGDVDVLADAEAVLDKLQPIEREVPTTDNRVFTLRVQPYRAAEDRIGGVVITFFEITERKRQEANLAFLAEVSADFAPRLSANEIMNRVGEKLARHLSLSRCDFSEVDAASDRITTFYDWRRSSAAPSVLGEHRISTFLSEAGRRQYIAGELTVVDNSWTSPLMSAPPEMLQQLDIGAVVDAPYLENGRWTFLLSACRSQPTTWRQDEIELIRELTARIYIRIERARAEEAVQASEQSLRVLIENLPGGAAFIVDRELRYLLAEGEALATAGLHPPDLVGKTIYEALPADLAAEYAPTFQRCLAGEPFAREHDAHGFSYISRGTPLFDANGEVYAVLVVSYDISERKRAETALQESEARFRILADVVPQLIWTNDAGGSAIYFNQRWYDYSGLSYGQSAGLGWQAMVHPDDAPASVERWQRALAKGETFDTEFRLRRADGVYRWHLGRNVPLHDSAGRIAGWFGSATDIEELKQTEANRRESEERFRLLVEGARDYAMFLLDPNNRITFWSTGAERLFGWSEAAALGQSGAIIFTPEDRECGAVERELSVALTEGRAEDRRWHARKDGTRLFVDGVLIRLDDEAGQLRGFVKIGRDATAQRQAEEALRRAHDELEQRVAERTAELLRLSTTRQELLQRLVTAQEDERRRIARELHDSLGQYLSALALDLARIQGAKDVAPDVRTALARLQTVASEIDAELDRLTMELRPPALDDIGLDDALARYAEEWTATSGVAVEVVATGFDDNRLPIAVEAAAYRIVQEALTNVRKHAQACNVSVLARREPGELRVIVEDDGIGFDPQAVGRERSGGRQLGLVGMSERAILAGGTITVESAPGNGTTIYLHIPFEDERRAA